MGIISKLIENARKGYIVSEIEDKILRGEELAQENKQILSSGVPSRRQEENDGFRGNNLPSTNTPNSGATSSAKYCVSCYAEIAINASFCHECGRQQ
jgi:hypothetical protein